MVLEAGFLYFLATKRVIVKRVGCPVSLYFIIFTTCCKEMLEVICGVESMRRVSQPSGLPFF